VILAAHNFGEDPRFWERATRGMDFVARQPGLPRVLAKARQQGVGVVAMKTLVGARINDLRPFETAGGTFAQAALRWALSQPDTDSLVVTMTSREQVDEYLGASGFTRPRGADRGLLRAYLAKNGASHCRQGCDACEGSCPHGVPVSDVLRSRMYAEDYGDALLAREAYAQLGAGASACLACDGSPCAGACPFGLPVGALTRRTHRLLG
jgi:predicted aldo/keto reductase-like oxidoreductase